MRSYLILFLSFLLATSVVDAYSEPLAAPDVSKVESLDAGLYALGLNWMMQADEQIAKMQKDPAHFMQILCQQPAKHARSWVYMNAAFHYDAILTALDAVKLKFGNNIGSLAKLEALKQLIANRREIYDMARSLQLSDEVVVERLGKNDDALDRLLIESGSTVAATPIDSQLEADFRSRKTLMLDMQQKIKKTCGWNPQDQHTYSELQ